MKLEYCDFPEEFLYDIDNDVWVGIDSDQATVGVTSIYSSMAGKLSSVKVKDLGTLVERGRVMATLESPRYFGVVRSPFSCIILVRNHLLNERPKVVNDSPYEEGWLAKVKPLNLRSEIETLKKVHEIRDELTERIKSLHVRCFSVYPDQEMFEIGVECAAVISKLNELFPSMRLGDVVHLVSDDATADIEMDRWTWQTGNELVESRKEQNLWHFLVRKKS